MSTTSHPLTSASIDDGPVEGERGDHPTESFDVEPPYVPDHDSLQAVETFGGTVLLVTHDRSLLTNVRRTRTIVLRAGQITSDTPT